MGDSKDGLTSSLLLSLSFDRLHTIRVRTQDHVKGPFTHLRLTPLIYYMFRTVNFLNFSLTHPHIKLPLKIFKNSLTERLLNVSRFSPYEGKSFLNVSPSFTRSTSFTIKFCTNKIMVYFKGKSILNAWGTHCEGTLLYYDITVLLS